MGIEAIAPPIHAAQDPRQYHYVRQLSLSSFLIATPEGHILIDSTL